MHTWLLTISADTAEDEPQFVNILTTFCDNVATNAADPSFKRLLKGVASMEHLIEVERVVRELRLPSLLGDEPLRPAFQRPADEIGVHLRTLSRRAAAGRAELLAKEGLLAKCRLRRN